MKTRIAFLTCLFFVIVTPAAAQRPTELFLRGYSVIPSPQKVELQDGEIVFDDSWSIDAGRLAKDHIAVRALLKDLREFHSIALNQTSISPAASSGAKTGNLIRFSVREGPVNTDH